LVACRWAGLYCKKTSHPPTPAGGFRIFWLHAAGRALCCKNTQLSLSPAAAGGFRKFWLHAAGRACTVKMKESLYNPQGVGLLTARLAIRNFVPAGRQNRKEDDRLLAARTARGKKKWLGFIYTGKGERAAWCFLTPAQLGLLLRSPQDKVNDPGSNPNSTGLFQAGGWALFLLQPEAG